MKNKKIRIPYIKYYRLKKKHKKCQICGKRFTEPKKKGEVSISYLYDRMEIHRIIPGTNGGTYNKENIQVICGNCHYKIHQDEFSEGQFFMLRYEEIIKNLREVSS